MQQDFSEHKSSTRDLIYGHKGSRETSQSECLCWRNVAELTELLCLILSSRRPTWTKLTSQSGLITLIYKMEQTDRFVPLFFIQAGWFLNAAVFDSPPVQSGLTSPTLQTTEKWKECDSHHTSSQQFSTIITTPNIFIGRVSESLCSTFLSTRKEKDHRSENQILFSCNLLCVFVVLLLWVFKWAVVWSAVSKKEVWQDLWRNLSFQWEQHLEYYNALLSFCLCLCSFANKKTPKLQNNSKSVMSCVHAGKVPK